MEALARTAPRATRSDLGFSRAFGVALLGSRYCASDSWAVRNVRALLHQDLQTSSFQRPKDVAGVDEVQGLSGY